MDPAVFRHGQLVQVQASFSTIPMSGNKGTHKMLLKLRSVALIDRSMQQVAIGMHHTTIY